MGVDMTALLRILAVGPLQYQRQDASTHGVDDWSKNDGDVDACLLAPQNSVQAFKFLWGKAGICLRWARTSPR